MILDEEVSDRQVEQLPGRVQDDRRGDRQQQSVCGDGVHFGRNPIRFDAGRENALIVVRHPMHVWTMRKHAARIWLAGVRPGPSRRRNGITQTVANQTDPAHKGKPAALGTSKARPKRLEAEWIGRAPRLLTDDRDASARTTSWSIRHPPANRAILTAC